MSALGGCGRCRRLTAAWLVLVLASCVGCGGPAEPRYPSTNLGGTITIDGARVVDGVVAFSSLDARLGRIVVSPIVRGRYIAERVPLGKVLAVVSAYKLGAPGRSLEALAVDAAAPETSVTKMNLVPERYRPGFELDVTQRSSDVNFTMRSGDPPPAPPPPPAPAPDTAPDLEAPRFGVEAGAGSDYNESNLPPR